MLWPPYFLGPINLVYLYTHSLIGIYKRHGRLLWTTYMCKRTSAITTWKQYYRDHTLAVLLIILIHSAMQYIEPVGGNKPEAIKCTYLHLHKARAVYTI